MADLIAGRIALITGGANGIGAAYVRELFKRGMKACTISDIDEEGNSLAAEMNCKYGKGKAIFVKADSVDYCELENSFERNMEEFDGLDLVVNNAGIFRDQNWEHMIDLNVKATVQGSLLGIKYMGKNNGACGGTIVNTASILGLQRLSGSPVGVGTKHFVIGFTRSMGTKFWYDLTGCRFLTICPGLTVTPMITGDGVSPLEGFPGLSKLLTDQIDALVPQSVEHLAKGFNTMYNEGENGSIWVGEENTPIYEVAIPDRRKLRKYRPGWDC